MCPAGMSTASPSGNFRPSLMMVFKSEPSGFADNTRPAPRSRKEGRPGVVELSAAVGLKAVALIRQISLLRFQCEFEGRRNGLEPDLRATFVVFEDIRRFSFVRVVTDVSVRHAL